MKKIFKYLMMTFVATACLGLASCGGDDSDEPTPDTDDKVVTGNVSLGQPVVILRSGSDYMSMWIQDERVNLYTSALWSPKITCLGTVSNLKAIKQAPITGWGADAGLVDGGGYVISYVVSGVPYYVRLFLKENRDVSGALVGVNYSCQAFTPSNI